jgi:ribose 5-phosphate isomerase B
MRVSLAADHAGYECKDRIKEHLLKEGHEVIDEGTNSPDSADYPVYAEKACRDVVEGRADFAILVCGSGEGMCIAANKVKGIRCGIGYNDEVSELSRRHNDANAIAFGARFMDTEDVMRRVDIFLKTPFEGGRHERRVGEIVALESKNV